MVTVESLTDAEQLTARREAAVASGYAQPDPVEYAVQELVTDTGGPIAAARLMAIIYLTDHLRGTAYGGNVVVGHHEVHGDALLNTIRNLIDTDDVTETARLSDLLDALGATPDEVGALLVSDGTKWTRVMDPPTASGQLLIADTGSPELMDWNHITSLTEDFTPDGAADYVLAYDASDGFHKKVLINNLPSGGGGAPTNASYVTLGLHGDLSAERVLAAGQATEITDGGANGNVTINSRTQIFPTNVTGVGTITDKVYQADTVPIDKILSSFKSDNDNITLTVQIHVINDSWQNAHVRARAPGGAWFTVIKQDWTEKVANARVFEAAIQITDAGTSGPIEIESSDGAATTVTYERQLDPPQVLTAKFDTHPDTTGGDPLVQDAQVATTSVQGTQQVRITGTVENHATHIYVKNAGVSSSLQGPFTITITGQFDILINVRASGNTGAQTATVYATVGVGGTPGPDKVTEAPGATVTVSHTVPTFGSASITYPVGQEAIKGSETADVTRTHTNAASGDTYLYDNNGTGELSIPATTTYAATKTVTRIAGSYRESGTNYRVTATRTEQNGTATTASTTVRIADATPVITIAGATSRLGTDDGTNGYRDHTITIQSSQANLSTYTASVFLNLGAGDTSSWQGATWATSGSNNYTRSLRVEDADIKAGGQAANNYTWGSLSVKNRAGREATVVTTNTTYQLGGFQKRRLTIPAWPNREADISVFAVDTTKLTAELLSKGGDGPGGGTVQTFDNSPGEGLTPDDEVDKFCISNGSDIVDDDGQFYYNKDQAAAIANTSGTAQVDIEETA